MTSSPLIHWLTCLYLAGYDATSKREDLDLAKVCFDWYFGHNSVGEWLYDPVTGGCFDALGPDGPNLNQGAESTICCLLAQLVMQSYLEELGADHPIGTLFRVSEMLVGFRVPEKAAGN